LDKVNYTKEVRIEGMNAETMLHILMNSGKISFPNTILGVGISRIVNGQTGQFALPDERSGYLEDFQTGNYLSLLMEDGSDAFIRLNRGDNSLIFEVNAERDKVFAVAEALIEYIDYDYGK
jgi:hypothetical protein